MSRLLGLVLSVALLVACSPSSGTMVGVVVEVGGDLTAITSFTLLVEGDLVVFQPAADGDYAFPLPHLRDHLRDGLPIRVGWERREGQMVAISLEDA
jgi:hypothetical protein